MAAAVRWSALLALALVVVFVFDERSRDDGDVAVLEPPPPVSDVVGAPLTAAADGAEAQSVSAANVARDVRVVWPCTPVADARLRIGDEDVLVVERGAAVATVPAGTPESVDLDAATGAWAGRLVGDLLTLDALNRVRGVIVDARTGRTAERARLTVATRMGTDTRLLDVGVELDTPDGRFDLGGWPVSPSATHARLEVDAPGHPPWTSDWIATAGPRFALDVGIVDLASRALWRGRVVSVDEPAGVSGALVHVAPDAGNGQVALARVDGAWQLPPDWVDAPRALTDGRGEFEVDVSGRAGPARLVVLSNAAPPWLSEPVDPALDPTRTWFVELGQGGGLDVVVEAASDAAFVVGLAHAEAGLVVERSEHVTPAAPLRLRGLSPGAQRFTLARALSPTLRESLVDETVAIAPGVTSERRWRDVADDGRLVEGEVLGGLAEGVVALVDAQTFERVAATAPVDADGRFSFRAPADVQAFAMLYGRDLDGVTVVGFAPVDLRVGGAVPTVVFDPTATRLVVTVTSGATSLTLVPSTGRPDLDRVAARALASLPVRDGTVEVCGLPVGRYEIRSSDDAEAFVTVDVARGVTSECTVP